MLDVRPCTKSLAGLVVLAGMLFLVPAAEGQTISIDDVMIVEGDSGTVDAVFTVSRSGITPLRVTVDYRTISGSAIAGIDFQPVMGSLEFMGTRPEFITVPIVGDTEAELSETFFVELFNPVNATIVGGNGQGTIQDDDPPELSIRDVTLEEGQDGTRDAVFEVELTGNIAQPIAVDYTTVDGTATVADSDYDPVAGTLMFQPGGRSTEEIMVPVNGDLKSEPNEMFFVDLSAPSGVNVIVDRGKGTILNDDDPPRLSINDVMVMEGDIGTVGASFEIKLSGKFSETVTVTYATADGTASAADGDYDEVPPTPITFEPGSSGALVQKIVVIVNGDTLAEPNETFFVNLSGAVNAEIEDSQGVGLIKDKDPLPNLSIADIQVEEGDQGAMEASLTVTLDKSPSETLRVEYASADGTATIEDNDYSGPVMDALSFEPGGSLTREVMVSWNGDTRVEGNETFSINLIPPAGEAGCTKCEGIITIINDDEGSKLRLADLASVVEAAGVATVTVERMGVGSEAARVTVTADAGTAKAGEDFTAVSQVLEWGPREAGSRSFEVPILDDSSAEEDETVVLRLSDASGADLGDPTTLELVIVDDDTPMELQTDGEPEITADANEEVVLKVVALRSDGQPLRGVAVTWQVDGDAELLDGETTLTDEEGVATQRVALGTMPGTVEVTAEIQGIDDTVSFEIEVAGSLVDMTDPAMNPGEAAVASVLEESCATATGEFSNLCDFVFELDDPADQAKVVEELTPEEASASGTVSQDSPRVQIGNISSRLAALRGGAAGRVGLGQLAFNLRGQSLGVGQVWAGFAKRAEEREWLDAAVDRAMLAYQQGGGSSAPELESAAESPLGFFVSGKISIGDRPDSEREAGFDFETLGLTAGLDYSFSERFVGGVALGYLDTQTDIVADGGELEARGYSLSGFGMYYVGDFFVEGVLSYGLNDYDQIRNIDLPQPFQGQTRFVARSNASGEQLSFGLGAGYEANFGATAIAGTGNLTWVNADIDGFIEDGAGPFNLRIGDQTVESLQSQARLDATRAISLPSWNVVVHPALSLAYMHEFANDSRLIRGSFVEDASGSTFDVPTEEPDRDFFRFSMGLTVAWNRGRTAFLLYDQDLDRTDLNVYTISFGMRLGL